MTQSSLLPGVLHCRAGEFPPKSAAGKRSSNFYYKYFPNGGYLNSHNGEQGMAVKRPTSRTTQLRWAARTAVMVWRQLPRPQVHTAEHQLLLRV